MKKPFYYTVSNIHINLYQIEGNIPRLITTILRDSVCIDLIISYLIENKLGDKTSKLIKL